MVTLTLKGEMFSVGKETHKHIFIYVSFINTSFKYVIRIYVYVSFPTADFPTCKQGKAAVLSYNYKNQAHSPFLKVMQIIVCTGGEQHIHSYIYYLLGVLTHQHHAVVNHQLH